MFFGLLTVWEGPLYVSVSGSSTPEFQVDGASGFHGIEIYGPEHSNAEWHGDDIGLICSFDWQRSDKFPPIQLRFAYPNLPRGYSQKAPLVDATPALDPDATYTVVIRPAMGMPEYFTLHGEDYLRVDWHLPKHRMSTRPRVLGASQRSRKERPCSSSQLM